MTPLLLCSSPSQGHFTSCRCGGKPADASTLHDKLAAYLWEVRGLAGLAPVTAHYARGGDRFAFAAGAVLGLCRLTCRNHDEHAS